jgi:hypothetical protein
LIHRRAFRPYRPFPSAFQIKSAVAAMGFRETLNEDIYFGFIFDASEDAVEEETPEEETDAAAGEAAALEVQVPFSRGYTRTFLYNADLGEYEVFHRDGRHMDALGQTPVNVTNILIQSVKMRVIPGDAEGRREVSTVGKGAGWLITGGTYRAVQWEKKDHTSPTMWFFDDGMPMHMRPGKTWVCLFQDSGEVIIN